MLYIHIHTVIIDSANCTVGSTVHIGMAVVVQYVCIFENCNFHHHVDSFGLLVTSL